MVQSSRLASDCLRRHGARACTDVTGFGLLGHLIEMTRPSGVDAELSLSAIPVLPGAEETVAAGILSSLQPANVRLRRGIRDQARWREHPRYPLLFDPQTAGGLLAGVPKANAEACVRSSKPWATRTPRSSGRCWPRSARALSSRSVSVTRPPEPGPGNRLGEPGPASDGSGFR